MVTTGRPLTTTSVPGASLTCPSAVSPLTHSSPRVAPEQPRACDSRLACKHNTLSQIVNPMIQAGTRLLPAPVSSLLYTLASANGEQMQGNRKPCQLHADKQPTASVPALRASRWPAVLQKHVKNLDGGLLKKKKKEKKNNKKTPPHCVRAHAHVEELKAFSTAALQLLPQRLNENEHREKPVSYVTDEKLLVLYLKKRCKTR